MNFTKKNYAQRINFQMAPMIDIMFLLLIFFMSAAIFAQLETELNISIPAADASTEIKRQPGEIIINIMSDGEIIVNQRKLNINELTNILKKISDLYKGQAVIIRADRKTHHEDVIQVLNACAKTNIWNVSFATLQEKQ